MTPSHHKTRISNSTSLSSLDGVVEKRLEKSFILQTPKMEPTQASRCPSQMANSTNQAATMLPPTSTSTETWTTPSSRPTPLTWISAELSMPTLAMLPSTLATLKTTLTSLSRLESILTSTGQGFKNDFEVMNDLIGGVQRELRDQICRTSKPRFEEAESSGSRGESTSWGQTWSRTSTSTTSTATSTARLTVVSEKMSSPTPAVQPHWKAEAKLVSKGKELENKSVKDEDQSLKLDIGRPDEEEDQGPNLEVEQHDEQDDAHDQVSRRSNNQVAGVETRDPAYGKLHSQATGDEHDDLHNQVYGELNSQVAGVETQVSASRRPNSQVLGVGTQVSVSRKPSKQVAGVETQGPATRVTGGEVQSSDSEEFIAQPPYCLEQLKLTTNRMAHSCKTNSGFTERLLLRNSSKDTDNPDKNFRKEVKVLKAMDKLKEVVKAENPKTVFHNNSTKSLESPQTPRIGGDFLGTCSSTAKIELYSHSTLESSQTPRIGGNFLETCNLTANWAYSPAANWKKRKKNFFDQSTSTDWLRVIIGKPIAFYREFGEDSEFFSDCLATQKELQESGRSGPRFLILIKNQKEPQNQTIIEKLEKRGCSGPRFFILMKNRKDPKNKTISVELKKGQRAPGPTSTQNGSRKGNVSQKS